MEWRVADRLLLRELLSEALEENRAYLHAEQRDALVELLQHLRFGPPTPEEVTQLAAFSLHFSESTGIRIRALIEPEHEGLAAFRPAPLATQEDDDEDPFD